jgi:4-aminobutyrate aminotransferase/(S)-3-amino-2-methylpropionate transaminase
VSPPGPASKSALQRLEQVECPAFGRRRRDRASLSGTDAPVLVFATGNGSNVFDLDGNRYVDLAAGFGSVLLGHGFEGTVRALGAQAERLIQGLGDVYSADLKIALLERVAALHPGHRAQVLLGQSGSDAVTAALKTAMLATGKPGVVAFEASYHGLGYGPLAACGLRESYRAPFAAQLNPHVTFVPYARSSAQVDRALDAIEQACRAGDTGAVLIEPILGRGGCVVPPDAFLTGAAEIAHRHGALIIADEIWTALGRAGSMIRTTAIQVPIDILCLGKALGGGLPLSACVAPEEIMRSWARDKEVTHTSTHSGAPLACATAIATLDALKHRRIIPRAREMGARIKELARSRLASIPGVVDVRGEGLMIGIELESGGLGVRVMHGMLQKGYIVLTGGITGEVITWTPPLNITEPQLAGAISAMQEVLSAPHPGRPIEPGSAC